MSLRPVVDWPIHCLRRYADFSGRASRPEYWWFYLVVFCVNVLLSYVSARAAFAWSVATALPMLAVASRRLHDTDHSALWLVPVFAGVAIILALESLLNGRPPLPKNSWVLTIAFLLFFLLWISSCLRVLFLLCKRGLNEPNRFGTVPSPVPGQLSAV
jgi:uncharacterized membrane protein YhaH (DUF805 family)